MKRKTHHKKAPAVIYENGEPSAVIIDIQQYKKLLEQLEDIEDLNALKDMRRKPLKFRKLDDYLKELEGV